MTHPFKVANWNVHHDSTFGQCEPTFDKIMDWGADLLILQEINQEADKIPQNLRSEYGLGLRSAREFCIAWNRDRFRYVRHSVPLMSPTEYWSMNYSLVVVLADLEAHTHLKVMSYHPPAHVQAPKHVTHDKVMKVHHEFADKRRRIAHRADIPFLGGGDSNIDPQKGWAPKGGWDFEYAGLRYFRAAAPTHGPERHIDELVGLGVRQMSKGRVLDNGPSDHRPVLKRIEYVQ